ncbi:MAG TPA: DUF4159 domain-containing protein [Vicinamibacterales bacterium]|nr:DUF4159 domain-containing protein [Vicinamibacterales bacterium]
MRARRALAIAAALVLALAAIASAQYRGFGRMRRVPPRLPTGEASFDGGFNFCRMMYSSQSREPGGQGWSTDYPDADINFSIRLAELTKTRVSKQPSGVPSHFVTRLTDPWLTRCPFLLGSDVGTMSLRDDEVVALRDYLLKGGFLWVDDFWGTRAWNNFQSEMARVLPPGTYPFRDIGPEHAIYRTMFPVAELPQIPSIQFWRGSGGETSERGSDSAQAHLRGLSDGQGRLMVLATHNTDISDAWEREGEDPEYFYHYSPSGYAVAVNIVLYAMSH